MAIQYILNNISKFFSISHIMIKTEMFTKVDFPDGSFIYIPENSIIFIDSSILSISSILENDSIFSFNDTPGDISIAFYNTSPKVFNGNDFMSESAIMEIIKDSISITAVFKKYTLDSINVYFEYKHNNAIHDEIIAIGNKGDGDNFASLFDKFISGVTKHKIESIRSIDKKERDGSLL